MKNKVFIIAEAGVNHNGNPQIAREMVQAAFDAGADAVKFQTFKAEKLVSPETPLADYQKEQQTGHHTQFSLLKQLELSNSAHRDLFDFCRVTGIEFMSTPFDMESAQLLKNLGVKRFKIGSGDLTNLPLLRKVGQYRQEIILSTGMGTLDEIRAALNILTTAGTSHDQIVILHANTEYPTPFEDVNLRAMLTIAKKFHTRVGYSDHTPGIKVPAAALAPDASDIENHFPLN
ncbi:MAG: N-acetylneuraminate synthase family protein, partial [Bacteroidales bacterium]|nr:N-acetylneuraminate synthase family protein [Bacteroidales bacterium]